MLPNGARRVHHWRADAARLKCLKPSVRPPPCDALHKYTQTFASKAPSVAYTRYGCQVNRLATGAAPANNNGARMGCRAAAALQCCCLGHVCECPDAGAPAQRALHGSDLPRCS